MPRKRAMKLSFPRVHITKIFFSPEKNILLRSTDPLDPSIVESTIIDGTSSGSVVTFSGSEATSCVLSGFTIMNGLAWQGGGINGENCNATISHNIITSNTVEDDYNLLASGGGIFLCHGSIRNNRIVYNRCKGDNSMGGGGLIFCNGRIENNQIMENRSDSFGGGARECNALFLDNVISGNVAGYGGALYFCHGTLMNNTIHGNRSEKEEGALSFCSCFISNCIIWGNGEGQNGQISGSSTPFYSCIQGWQGGGKGNISDDPLLADPDRGDFHLLPGSPCIDSGYSYYLHGDYIADIDGESRLAGTSTDMGCDEAASMPDTDGDLLPDSEEQTRGTFKDNRDTDGDGLMDGPEVIRGTNPTIADAPPGISIPLDYSDPQEAVFCAFPGETVIFEPVVHEANLLIPGKNIHITGSDPGNTEIVEKTILDGKSLSSVITLEGSEDETCVIEGLTITGGDSFRAGGIFGNGAEPTISQNIITTNTCLPPIAFPHVGGGISSCDGFVINNLITGNTALAGGGLSKCNGRITSNTITNNTVTKRGGGISLCNGQIDHNTISNNTADVGGGIYSCRATIQNNRIFDNAATQRGGGLNGCRGLILNNRIYNNESDLTGAGLDNCGWLLANNLIHHNRNTSSSGGGGVESFSGILLNNTIYGNASGGKGGGLYRCRGIIANCIIWGNQAPDSPQIYDGGWVTHCCVQDWEGVGDGNISSVPGFLDEKRGDYHLQSSSPCIDGGFLFLLQGDYIADLDGHLRISGGIPDMGCFEWGALPDKDGDLLADNGESSHSTDPENPDTDGDGLADGIELLRGTLPDFRNDPPGLSIPGDFSTIQEGLFHAFPGEKITVKPGTHKENICFNGKNIQLTGEDPSNPETVKSTVVHGRDIFSTVYFSGREEETCILEGVTITGGAAFSGGGIQGNHAEATIRRNRIVGNAAGYCGGGIDGICGLIDANLISDNTAEFGGGLSNCPKIIQNNMIVENAAEKYGGGISSCHGWILNNTLVDNTGRDYSAMYNSGSFIRNCIIWSKVPVESLVDSSGEISYSCIMDWGGGGEGNFSDPPCFVDPEKGDYQLLSYSPCIDAGGSMDHFPAILGIDLTSDFEGDPRPFNSTEEPRGDGSDMDIGADEFSGTVPTPSPTPTPTPQPTCVLHVPDEYPTIQSAIDNSGDGCLIVVSPGIYRENIQFGGRNIILRSDDPSSTETINSTIIDGERRDAVVSFSGNEGTSCVLAGFTIRNGKGINSGGIDGNWCRATILKNRIVYNQGNWCGGVARSDGLVESNYIAWNESPIAGGVGSCNGSLRGNVISLNRGRMAGGIMYCDGLIENNTIYSNVSDDPHGGGAGVYRCDGTIRNCIIRGNIPKQLDNFTDPVYTCLEGERISNVYGNINVDPHFLNSDIGDFRLGDGSPCIDAGHPAPWFSDALFPPGKGNARNDLGATGGSGNFNWGPDKKAISLEILQGFQEATPDLRDFTDTNGDGILDVADLVGSPAP